jgi:hypothetical protein
MRFVILPLLAACITFAPACSTRSQTADGPVMEVVTFRLNSGVTDRDFLDAAKGTGAMVAAQPGFVRRSLLRDDAGLWTDTVEWQSLAQANAAAEVLNVDPAFAPFWWRH